MHTHIKTPLTTQTAIRYDHKSLGGGGPPVHSFADFCKTRLGRCKKVECQTYERHHEAYEHLLGRHANLNFVLIAVWHERALTSFRVLRIVINRKRARVDAK